MKRLPALFVVVTFINSCGGSDSPTQSDATHERTSKNKSFSDSAGASLDFEGKVSEPSGGDRPFEDVVNQYGALDHHSKAPCLTRSNAVLAVKNYGPSYERFVGHFKAQRNDIRFFIAEARASSGKSLHDKFMSYLESRLRGAIRFDAAKASEVNTEIARSGLPTATKLKRIAKAVIDNSHDGFEGLPKIRDEIVSCLQEVHRSFLRDHDMQAGNNPLRMTIDRLKSLKVTSLNATTVVSETDQYLDTSVAELKETFEQLFSLYDILAPGFFSKP